MPYMEVTRKAKDEAGTVSETRSRLKHPVHVCRAGRTQRTEGALDRIKKTLWRVRDWAQSFSPNALMEVRS